MDSLDVNDTCKRPISLQKYLYLVCQANLFRDPKWCRDPYFEKLCSRMSCRSPVSKFPAEFSLNSISHQSPKAYSKDRAYIKTILKNHARSYYRVGLFVGETRYVFQ